MAKGNRFESSAEILTELADELQIEFCIRIVIRAIIKLQSRLTEDMLLFPNACFARTQKEKIQSLLVPLLIYDFIS